jgi:hypothetical protein
MSKLKSDTFLSFVPESSVKSDTRLTILECIDKRVFNGFSQKDVSKHAGKSLSTIKRFESGRLDSLSLYCYYLDAFKHLPNRKKAKVPSWV